MSNVSEVFATALLMVFLIFIFKQLQNKYLDTIGGERYIKFGWMEKNFIQYTLTMGVLESVLYKPITEELIFRLPLLLFKPDSVGMWIVLALWSVLIFGLGHWGTPRVFHVTPKKIRNKLENSRNTQYFYGGIENALMDDVLEDYKNLVVKEVDRIAVKKDFNNKSVIYVLFGCIVGLVTSVITVWQQNIWYAVLVHCTYSIAMLIIAVQSSYKSE